MNRSLLFCFSFLVAFLFQIALQAQTGLFYSYGQQDPQFTQYMFNPMYFNPAATGTEQAFVATLNVRNQWVNIPGAPVSQVLTSHLPVYKISSGAGISVVNDIAGFQRNTGVMAYYSYHKNFKSGLLSLGIAGGIVQQSIDGSKLVTPTGVYENVVNHNDPNLPVSLTSTIDPDASAGIWFMNKKLTAGISATHILTPFLFGKENSVSTIQYNPNAYVYVAYQINVSDKVSLTPNVLYKTDLAESIVDVNTIMTYNNNLVAGLSYRGFINNQQDAIAILAGLNITDKWRISYSYDITTSALNAVSAGSHEVVLRYRIPMAKPRAGKMINNPRYIYH